MSVLSLPRSPTPREEYAYNYQKRLLHNVKCARCGEYIDLQTVVRNQDAYYCSKFCYHAHRDTEAFRSGRIDEYLEPGCGGTW